jgi:PPOX class probable F420-dependent enzyme
VEQEQAAARALKALEAAKYISLTTYRRSGEGVATPVWFAQDGEQYYVETGPRTGKMKRIQHTPRVTLAPCTFGGKVTGPRLEGTAHIVDSDTERERAKRLMARKYGLVRRLNYGMADVLRVLQRRPKGQLAYLAVTVTGTESGMLP